MQLPGKGRRSCRCQRRSVDCHAERTATPVTSSCTATPGCAPIWCPGTRSFAGSTPPSQDDQQIHQQFPRTRPIAGTLRCATHCQDNEAKRRPRPRSAIQQVCCFAYGQGYRKTKRQCTEPRLKSLVRVLFLWFTTGVQGHWQVYQMCTRSRPDMSTTDRSSIGQSEPRVRQRKLALAHCRICAHAFQQQGLQQQKCLANDKLGYWHLVQPNPASSAPKNKNAFTPSGELVTERPRPQPNTGVQKTPQYRIFGRTRLQPAAGSSKNHAARGDYPHRAESWINHISTLHALSTICIRIRSSGWNRWTDCSLDCQPYWRAIFKRRFGAFWNLAFIDVHVFCLSV